MNNRHIETVRHSMAHIMAAAIKQIWPKAKFGVGPIVENGFYYDIDLGDIKISEDDFSRIEEEMQKIISLDQEFIKKEVSIDEAIAWAKDNKQPYKEELLNDLKQFGTTNLKDLDSSFFETGEDKQYKIDKVSLYITGDFTDLCRGPHLESTKQAGSFKLTKVAGAYWRGIETNPQMQRVYGVAFSSKEELDEYINQIEQAKLRDHRKLGQELDLFCFSDLVGPGLPMFSPRGTIIIDKLQQYIEQVCRGYGFQKVKAPSLTKRELFEVSGHAAKFGEELFSVTSPKGHELSLKPVQCPHHTQIFNSRIRSYKDLPIRYMESDKQYRAEKTGEIGGLSRVYAITVEDGHSFCTVGQVKQEIINMVNIIRDFYSALGLWGTGWVSLSVRDYDNPDKYIGEPADWDICEAMLKDVSEELGLDARRCEGEAALYGPKLDFMFKDAIGKEIQIPTVQLDFATPKRFDLKYTDSEGKEANPVMVHRAVLGSYERFLVLLIENFAGWFPFWMAPEQVRILTINDSVLDYVDRIKAILDNIVLMQPLKYNELRYSVDDRNESLGKKIREATSWKIPIQIIIGNRDKESQELSLRTKDQEIKIPIDQLESYLKEY